ncbi:MAG: BamA/TamA family outer membrane protein [Candidatus Eisenbacteria bacterium]|nr:BamA/TamA family outer membrane protein [Candidatus Eisenbacteria bacterium]
MRARPVRRALTAAPLAPALVLAAVLLAPAPGRAAAARLEYRGSALTRSEVETLAAAALRAPRDSSATVALLAAVVERLQERGWLDARADAAWDAGAGARLALTVREGPRFRWGVVALEGMAGADSARFARGLPLRAGGVASPLEAARAVEAVLREVTDHGYPYARLGVSGWEAETAGDSAGRARAAVALRLSGALGPQVTVSRVRIEGLRVTRAGVAERALGRIAGLPYERAAAEAGRERLAQLGLFRAVSLRGLEGEADWSRAQLVYRVEEPRYNRFEGAVGVQGDAGVAGLASVELGNLLGTGRSSGVRWEARGRGISVFEARYAEPLLLGTPLRLEGAVAQQVLDTLYARTRWGARVRYALSAQERIEAGYEQERVVQERGEVREARLQSTVFALERDALDDALAPRRGVRARLSAAQAFKREGLRPAGTRTARASAVEAKSEWHRPLAAASGLTLELTGAGRFSSQRVLPLYERYPVGGAATLRGHDEEEFRVDRYALSRLEWRWFLGGAGQRVFLFWDHAWMATRLPLSAGGDRFQQLHRDGLGFGLRLEAAGGLVGVDYGLEPGRAPLEGKIHLRLISTF